MVAKRSQIINEHEDYLNNIQKKLDTGFHTLTIVEEGKITFVRITN